MQDTQRKGSIISQKFLAEGALWACIEVLEQTTVKRHGLHIKDRSNVDYLFNPKKGLLAFEIYITKKEISAPTINYFFKIPDQFPKSGFGENLGAP